MPHRNARRTQPIEEEDIRDYLARIGVAVQGGRRIGGRGRRRQTQPPEDANTYEAARRSTLDRVTALLSNPNIRPIGQIFTYETGREIRLPTGRTIPRGSTVHMLPPLVSECPGIRQSNPSRPSRPPGDTRPPLAVDSVGNRSSRPTFDNTPNQVYVDPIDNSTYRGEYYAIEFPDITENQLGVKSTVSNFTVPTGVEFVFFKDLQPLIRITPGEGTLDDRWMFDMEVEISCWDALGSVMKARLYRGQYIDYIRPQCPQDDHYQHEGNSHLSPGDIIRLYLKSNNYIISKERTRVRLQSMILHRLKEWDHVR